MKQSVLFLMLCAICFSCTKKQTMPDPESVLTLLSEVNHQYQATHSPEVRAFWDDAVYHVGNMAAFRLTQDTAFLHYSLQWAEYNHWQGATETNLLLWEYKQYGEDMQHVLFADWQICFQTYLDLAQALGEQPYMTARAKEVLSNQIQRTDTDYWWWVDALFMAMPVFTRMATLTHNELYINRMMDYFSFTDSLLYDRAEHLYYRDAKYIYPQHQTHSGAKDFWARGNGWAAAALAMVLEQMPATHIAYNTLLERFQQLCNAAIQCQQAEGHWTRSLLDSEEAPGYETSSTSLFCYALATGVQHGWLAAEPATGAALKAWEYLTQIALQDDFTIGYVQPIGEKAIRGQVLSGASATNFGIGDFLLAAVGIYQVLQTQK